MSNHLRSASRATRRSRRFAKSAKEITEQRDFAEVDAFFAQLESGEVDDAGGMIVRTIGNEQYSVLHALDGWLEYWRAAANVNCINYDDSAMVGLVNKLRYEMPLTLGQIIAAKAVVDQQRQMYRALPNNILNKIADQVTVRLQMEDALA